MRRRRKTKYTWLPASGVSVDSAEDETQDFVSFTERINVTGLANLEPSVGLITTVLNDQPENEVDATDISLADSIGSEYFLKRIVGKVFVNALAVVGNTGATALGAESLPDILATVGFFIAPELPPSGGSGNQGIPVGPADFYNPQIVPALRQPWIWRRSWLLTAGGGSGPMPAGNQDIAVAPASIFGAGAYPSTNAGYGSVLDGPHIDAKTARRVRQHERLFVACFAHSSPEARDFVSEGKFQQVFAQFTVDVRCLGALRKARNRSSFE